MNASLASIYNHVFKKCYIVAFSDHVLQRFPAEKLPGIRNTLANLLICQMLHMRCHMHLVSLLVAQMLRIHYHMHSVSLPAYLQLHMLRVFQLAYHLLRMRYHKLMLLLFCPIQKCLKVPYDCTS
jgi:hypothetical protein